MKNKLFRTMMLGLTMSAMVSMGCVSSFAEETEEAVEEAVEETEETEEETDVEEEEAVLLLRYAETLVARERRKQVLRRECVLGCIQLRCVVWREIHLRHDGHRR